MVSTQLLSLTHGQAPWCSYPCINEAKDTIHFSPANGIPAQSYRVFFEALSADFNVNSMDCRGAWPNHPLPTDKLNWSNLRDDLIEAMESQYDKPVIGMGHSLGGVLTLMAAAKRPDLFSKVVVIDGASLPNYWLSFIYDYIPKAQIYKMLPWIKQTLNRRKVWDSREQFMAHHRTRKTYQHFTDECMQDYANTGLRQRDDGKFELVFAPEWEAFIFRRVKFLWSVAKKVKQPGLIIHAENSNLYNNEQFDARKKLLPSNFETARLHNMDHLATHQDPPRVAALISDWLLK